MTADTVTFVPILPEYHGNETLPTCPDGSGDLWWDDASYARYQAWDGPTYYPERIDDFATTPGYCDGRPMIYELDFAVGHSCRCHTPPPVHDPAVPAAFGFAPPF